MDIKKEFTPVTIRFDSKEELATFKSIMRKVLRNTDRRWCSSSSHDNDEKRMAQYLEQYL
jgi:hypothetical protein